MEDLRMGFSGLGRGLGELERVVEDLEGEKEHYREIELGGLRGALGWIGIVLRAFVLRIWPQKSKNLTCACLKLSFLP